MLILFLQIELIFNEISINEAAFYNRVSTNELIIDDKFIIGDVDKPSNSFVFEGNGDFNVSGNLYVSNKLFLNELVFDDELNVTGNMVSSSLVSANKIYSDTVLSFVDIDPINVPQVILIHNYLLLEMSYITTSKSTTQKPISFTVVGGDNRIPISNNDLTTDAAMAFDPSTYVFQLGDATQPVSLKLR